MKAGKLFLIVTAALTASPSLFAFMQDKSVSQIILRPRSFGGQTPKL